MIMSPMFTKGNQIWTGSNMKISEYLIKKKIDSRIAIFTERYIKSLEKRRIEIKHDFTHMNQIFRPIGGQDKEDVFAGK